MKILAWTGLACMALFLVSVLLLLIRGDSGNALNWILLWLGAFLVTGGGAELTNFITLIKEMSGYDVRKGYPRFMFSASVGSGVYTTAATSAIGMVLSAKEDGLPDCVSVPEKPPVEEEEDTVEVVVTDETPRQNVISDEELANGSTGNLLDPEAFGEALEPKPARTKKVKIPKDRKPNFISIAWNTVKNGALNLYDKANQE